jgi:hypothetical protein
VPSSQNEPAAATELYHLTVDPDEEKNLAASAPERVAKMRSGLDAWWDGK